MLEIQRLLETRWPVLLVASIFLFGGIMLIVTGMKIRKQSKISAIISMILGVIIILATIYIILWTMSFGFNT